MSKDLIYSLSWAGALLAIALGGTLAHQLGYVDSDTVTRLVLGATGLMVASYGNRMPKAFVPDARARQATRVAGWSMAISGLIYAVLWAFAPFQVALVVGCGAVLAGIAVTFAYCLSQRGRASQV